jgi:hypothetical protein
VREPSFQALLREKLSPAAQKVLDLAIPLWKSHNGLLLRFLKKLRSGRAISTAQLRKLMIYASVDFEYESNAGDDLGWDRLGDGAHAGDAHEARGHAWGEAEEHEGRGDEPEENVLEHVDAVEVAVGDGVDLSFESQPDGDEAEPEVEGVLTLGIVNPTGEPGVPKEKHQEPEIDGRIKRPGHALLRMPPPALRATSPRSGEDI